MGSNRFLFEVRPDLFPQGFLTVVEMTLWQKFYDWLKQERKTRR